MISRVDYISAEANSGKESGHDRGRDFLAAGRAERRTPRSVERRAEREIKRCMSQVREEESVSTGSLLSPVILKVATHLIGDTTFNLVRTISLILRVSG